MPWNKGKTWRVMAEKKINERSKIAMFGHKRWSREGGVEIVVKELCTRMAQKGCEVTCYNRSRHHVNIIYSQEAKRKFEELVIKTKPDIVHLHIFQHQLSPSILDVCKKYNLPTVYTAHDLKMVCLNYKMMHHGHVWYFDQNGSKEI